MTSETLRRPDSENATPDLVEINLLDAVRTLLRGKYILLGTTFLGLLLGLLVSALSKPIYTAQAVFLPPKNTDLAGSAGAGALSLFAGGGSDSSDTYLALLASRTVADDVIDRAGLLNEWKGAKRPDARGALAGVSKFSVNKTALIQVEVKTPKPELSARIANAYLDALYQLNGDMVDSASAHRRVFFETQLEQAKQALDDAELKLKKTQEETGIVLPQSEAEFGLANTAQIQAQIGAAETRVAGLLVGATEQNPEVVEARGELNQLRAQLARQQADNGSRARGAGLASTSRLPGLTLEAVKKEREVKLRESLYNALVQQYEKARLTSIDPGPQLQIVDRAIVPDGKSGPNKRLIVLGATFLGFAVGLMLLLLARPVRRFLVLLREPAVRTPARGPR